MPSGEYDEDAPIRSVDARDGEIDLLRSHVEGRDKTIYALRQEKEQLIRIIKALLPQSVIESMRGYDYDDI